MVKAGMLENVVLTFLHWIPVSADAKSVFVGWTMFLHRIPVSTSMLIYLIPQTEIFTSDLLFPFFLSADDTDSHVFSNSQRLATTFLSRH